MLLMIHIYAQMRVLSVTLNRPRGDTKEPHELKPQNTKGDMSARTLQPGT